MLTLRAALSVMALVVGACSGAASQQSAAGPGPAVTVAEPFERFASVEDRTMTSGGRTRSYRVFTPRAMDVVQPAPLVIVLHGQGDTALGVENITHYDELAAREKFFVAYPQGVGNVWNAGACCGQAMTENVDDVGFVVGLIDDIARTTRLVDRSRVYVTGHSTGAILTYRIACERADVFAAVAPVGGAMRRAPTRAETLERSCSPSRAIPLIDVHGRADPKVWHALAVKAVEVIRRADGCPGAPSTATDRSTTIDTYGPCRSGAEVVMVSVGGWDWHWPTQAAGYAATVRTWEFLRRFSLPVL